ncbi:MAG: GAF domain-containing protein [Dehalococcoidia bacterium]
MTRRQGSPARARRSTPAEREFEVLAEIGRVMGSSLNIHDVYEAFATAVRQLLDFDRITVSLIDRERGTVTRSYVAGLDIPGAEAGTTKPLANSLELQVTEHGHGMILVGSPATQPVADDPTVQIWRSAGLGSMISAPLLSQGSGLGTIGLSSKEENAYSEADALLAERIALQIAGAIANASLHARLELEASERQLVASAGTLIGSSLSLPDVYGRLAEAVSKLVKFDRLIVSLVDDDGRYASDVYVNGVDVPGRTMDRLHPVEGTLEETVIRTGAPLRLSVHDPSSDAMKFPGFAPSIEFGFRSSIVVPVFSADRVTGSINLASVQPDAYSSMNEIRLQQIATHLSSAIANARLHEALERESREQVALAAIGRVISSSSDVNQVFDAFAAQVKLLMPVDRMGIHEIDEQGHHSHLRYTWGLELPDGTKGWKGRLTGKSVGHVVKNRSPFLVTRQNHEEAQVQFPGLAHEFDAGMRSLISVPLISEDRVIAVLTLRTAEDDAYGPREVALAERVGAQIAGVIANVRLTDQVRREANERLAIAEIGRIVSSTLNLEDVFSKFAEQAAKLISFDRISISLYDEEHQVLWDEFIAGVEVPGLPRWRRRSLEESINKDVINQRRPEFRSYEDLKEVADRFPGIRDGLEVGLKSSLSVPLVWQEQLVGTLNLRSSEPAAYSNRELELCEQIGAQIAGAIATSTLYAEARKEAVERSTIADIGRLVSSTLDLGTIYPEFAAHAKRLVPFDRMVIVLVDTEADEGFDAFVDGMEIDEAPGRWRFPLESSRTGEILRNRQPMVLKHDELQAQARTNPGLSERLDAGLRSFAGIPLIWQEQVIGCINLYSTSPDAYGDDEIAVAQQLCAQIAGAIATTSLYERSKREAEERATLAEIGRIISSSIRLEDVYPKFCEQVKKLMPFDRIVISLVDESSQSVEDAFVAGRRVKGFPSKGRHNLIEVIGDVIKQRKAASLNRAELQKVADRHPHFSAPLDAGLNSLLLAPLVWQDQVLGTLNLGCEADNAYGNKELALAEQIGAQIAGAIATSQLYTAAQRESEIRQSLAAIGAAAGSDLRLERVLERVADEVVKLMPYDRLAVTLVGPHDDKLRVQFVKGVPVEGFEVGAEVVRKDGAWEWKSTYRPSVRFGPMAKAGLKGWLEVPLGARAAGPTGYLAVRCREADFYTNEHLDLLERAAVQVTPAIQNALTHRQTLELSEERERAAKLEAQANELTRINEAKGQFLSTISHELKTPLTSIMAFTDILSRNRDENLSEKQLHQMDVVRRNARQLGALINDLLDISRIDAGRTDLNLEEFDFGELVVETADSLSAVVAEKGQRLEVKVPKAPLLVTADRERVAQVISNLVSNASKYSPRETPVQINAAASGQYVRVRVRDFGQGISKSDQVHLFTPFFRADNTLTRSVSGTGLGLAIVRRLVELHGGTVSVQSEEGDGAEFTVRLPRSRE